MYIKNTKYLFIPTNLGGKKLLKVNRGIAWAVTTKIVVLSGVTKIKCNRLDCLKMINF